MKKTLLMFSLVALSAVQVWAQKKVTTSATVKFDASTSLDALPKAENKTVIATLNTQNGTLAFEAAVKNFSFSNPMMQEHFNGANWLNSDKFPTFTYKGTITDLSAVNFGKDGSYPVKTEGVLTVKGVEQKVAVPATISIKGGVITAAADFTIKLSDYGISGAPIDAGKVSKEPKIAVSAELK